jgi:hypothetical protein
MNVSPARHPHDPGIVETVLSCLPDVLGIYRYGSAGSEFE